MHVCLPLAILCLPKLVHDQDENELLASRGVGRSVGLGVVPSVRRALKGTNEVMGMNHRDMLVIVERPMETTRKKVTQNKMVPERKRDTELKA